MSKFSKRLFILEHCIKCDDYAANLFPQIVEKDLVVTHQLNLQFTETPNNTLFEQAQQQVITATEQLIKTVMGTAPFETLPAGLRPVVITDIPESESIITSKLEGIFLTWLTGYLYRQGFQEIYYADVRQIDLCHLSLWLKNGSISNDTLQRMGTELADSANRRASILSSLQH